jgi:F-type H+-transporting ATPase subunit b
MQLNPSILFWSAVNFLILFFLLRQFFWGPLLEMMESREQEIEDNIVSAEEAREEAQALKASYEEQLSEARREAQRIIEQATERGEEVRENIVEDAREEANELIERAERSIRREREAAIAALREEVADLAVRAAGRVLDRELSEDDNRRLAVQFVEEVGEPR